MKRLKSLLMVCLTFVLILSLSNVALAKSTKSTLKSYKITFVSAKLVENNHVGNEWSTGAEVNGQAISVGKSKTLKLKDSDVILLAATAVEEDKVPDEGAESEEIEVSSLTKPKTTSKIDVMVTENRGRYSGNTATWTFTFKIEKL